MDCSVKTSKAHSVLADWLSTPFCLRSLVFGFIRQDIKGRFAGSVMGIVWSLLFPLSNILIYFFVFSVIFRMKMPVQETGTASFTIYLLSGLIPWMAFSEGLTRATNCLLDNASIISKVSFPVRVLPWSVVSVSFILNGIGLLVFLCYLAARGQAKGSWIVLPLLFLMLYGFTLGIAAFLASVTVFLRDLREIVNMGLQLWFYATPILYPLSMVPNRLLFLINLNPAYFFIVSLRQCLLQGIYWSSSFSIALCISILSIISGGYCFMRLRNAFGDVL